MNAIKNTRQKITKYRSWSRVVGAAIVVGFEKFNVKAESWSELKYQIIAPKSCLIADDFILEWAIRI